MVKLADPPPTRPINPRYATLAAGTRLVRIYNPIYLEPNGYSHHGPRSRFDHHLEADPPAHDAARGIYYAAPDLSGCVVEVFGDAGVIERGALRVAVVEPGRSLRLLDLSGDGAWHSGSVAALTKDADRQLTQRWARYIYEQHTKYGAVDGVQFENAHNAALAYALFERAGSLRVVADFALSDSRLSGTLAQIALDLNLILPDVN
jgi:hypothetical protein